MFDPAVDEGFRLFNNRKFFEAHEALEAVWLKARDEERLLLHGLIQVAAAFHHHARHNRAGFCSLLTKGLRKLERCRATDYGIDLDVLRSDLERWRIYLGGDPDLPAPPLPHIHADR